MSAPDAAAACRATRPGAPVFAEAWQARAFALAAELNARGRLAWPDFAAALGAELARDGDDYWRAWLGALEGWLAAEGLAAPEAVGAIAERWRRAAEQDAARRADPAGERRQLERRARGRAAKLARPMQTVYSPRHAGHGGNVELMPGEIVPAFELPRRAEIVRARVEEVGLGPVAAAGRARPRGGAAGACAGLSRLPAAGLAALGGGGARRHGDALRLAGAGAARRRAARRTSTGCSASTAMDAGATFVEGTWDAVKASHDVALTAAGLVRGRRAARPSRSAGRRGTTPGRGSPAATASSTTPRWRRSGCASAGAARVSVLDIDYHHGNGTQAIFYARGDVQVVNIHADPRVEYPYFLGHADERGDGRGRGVQPQPAAAARHRTSPAGRRRWTTALRGGGGLRAGGGWWSRSGSTPSAATRSAGSGSTRRTIR